MFGIITVVMIFSIPILGILTSHFEKQSKTKHKMLQVEMELEKLKHENFLMEGKNEAGTGSDEIRTKKRRTKVTVIK